MRLSCAGLHEATGGRPAPSRKPESRISQASPRTVRARARTASARDGLYEGAPEKGASPERMRRRLNARNARRSSATEHSVQLPRPVSAKRTARYSPSGRESLAACACTSATSRRRALLLLSLSIITTPERIIFPRDENLPAVRGIKEPAPLLLCKCIHGVPVRVEVNGKAPPRVILRKVRNERKDPQEL